DCATAAAFSTTSTPFLRASSIRRGSTSEPTTVQPCSTRLRAMAPPMVPRPMMPMRRVDGDVICVPPSACFPGRRLCRPARDLHDDLDGVVDALARVAQRGGKVLHHEGVRVDPGGVETLLGHEGVGAVGRALALAADAVDVDVVADDMA